MGCWNIFQKEKHIAQRAGRHRRDALALQSLIPLCSYQLAPIPRLSATAAALQRNVFLAEHCCKGVWNTRCSDFCPVCAGETDRKVWLTRLYTALSVGATWRSTVPREPSDVISVAPLEGGLTQAPREGSTLIGASACHVPGPSTDAQRTESSGGVH